MMKLKIQMQEKDWILMFSRGDKDLKEVVIPANVTTINNSAFTNCHNLNNITVKGKDVKNAIALLKRTDIKLEDYICKKEGDDVVFTKDKGI